MNKEEKFIQNIKAEFDKEKSTKSYERVKRMAKTISENLYSEDSHFIYELIQNAQDNSYKKDIQRKLDFYVSNSGVLIKNNEKGFEESHIKSICDFNDSTKSKQKALGYIGEKGIGFKSVFAITDEPAIHSNGYKFYFKKDEYIEPYWIDSLKEYPEEFQDDDTTNIYLPYSEDFNNKEDIKKKINDIEPILLLFLDNLDEINIYHEKKQVLSVSKTFKVKHNQNITVIESYDIKNQFVVYSKEINCRKDIKEEKREGVEKRKLILAFPIEKIDDTRLFAFLPTEINTGLPFLIQADFLLTASRGDILKNKAWNKWLFDEIVDFFIEAFAKLQSIGTQNYLKYLDQDKSTNNYIDSYYQLMLDKLQYEKLFLSVNDEYVTSSQICILEDFDFMIKYLEDIKYSNSDGEKYFYLKKDFYIPEYLIDLWDIEVIDKDEFLKILGQVKTHISKKFEDDNVLFEKLLDCIGKNYNKKEILSQLPILPFDEQKHIIFKTKKSLQNIQLFYNLDEKGELNDIFDELKIIATKYQNTLQEIPFYSNVLDVKNPDIVEILSSLEDNEEFFADINNNIKLLVYIKNNYLGESQQQIIELLAKNYQFISKTNFLFKHDYEKPYAWNNNTATFSTKLYISKEYLNSKNCIEKIVNTYCTEQGKENIDFISEKYLEYDKKVSDKDLKDLQKEWKDFFDVLKINDDLKLIDETLEMYAYDSQDDKRLTTSHLKNIPFIASPLFENCYSKNYKENNFSIKKLSESDSVFLFKKLSALSDSVKYHNQYRRIKDFYRDFKYDFIFLPWIDMVRNDYPIFVGKTKYKVQDFYLNVDEELQKFFLILPKEYLIKEHNTIDKIFNLKEKPNFNNIQKLILDKKLKKFEDIKSLLSYIYYHYSDKKTEFSEIPILKNSKIIYVPLEKLIWENGKELGLVGLKLFYGNDFKKFFVKQVGIQEKPTIKQFIKYLKIKPKNYTKIFNKFIIYMDELLDDDKKPDIASEKIILINKNFFSLNEIIFNDESIKTDDISNLLTVSQKILPSFQKIVNKYKVKKISEYDREIRINDSSPEKEIQDIYLKLLNFTWDYIFSKNQKKFQALKENRDFILETKNVNNGALADIILKINIDNKYINLKQDISIKDNTIYISNSMDTRKIGTEISKYIAKKVGMDFEKIERFYDKVYRIEDFEKDEYYDEEGLEEAKGNDSFDSVFEKILNVPIDEKENADLSMTDENKNEESKKTENNKEPKPNNIPTLKCPICGLIECKDSLEIHMCKKHKYRCKDKSNNLNNKKSTCPECYVDLNEKNLKKHLCKVHNINCDDSSTSSGNNQNTQNPLNLKDAIKDNEGKADENGKDINPDLVMNEEAYRTKLQKNLKENLGKSDKSKKRYSSSRKVKVGEKETKSFLEKQYKGHCQICGFTFEKKGNKGKYFEMYDWLKNRMKQKLNIIDAGSSLCLCSRCHSGLSYGDFEAKFLKKLEDTDLPKVTFEDFSDKTDTRVDDSKIPKCYNFVEMDMYKIPIRLLNENKNIFYTEEHFLHFYNLFTFQNTEKEGK